MFHLSISRSATLLLLLGIGSVLVVVLVSRGSAATAPEAAPAAADALPTHTVTSATRTVPVRGVVTAAATLPVRAERGGVVAEVPVTEGDRVAAGALLARQERPVATADLARREAELSAARARGVIATTDASSSAAITAVRTVEAAALATIRERGANAKLEREVAAVYSALQASLATLADAASFLDANRSRVAADELRDFEAALAVVYGAVPERFTSGVRRPLPDTVTDLRRAVTALGAADSDPIRALELGRASEAALAEFSELLSATEAEFLDDAGVIYGGDAYAAYIGTRQAVSQALTGQVRAGDALTSAVTALAETDTAELSTVSVREREAAAAERIAAATERRVAASTAAAAAAARAAAAEVALGTLIAPQAGVVAEVAVERGAYVAPGEVVLTLVSDRARELVVSVAAADAAAITPGGIVRTPAGKRLGVVDRIAPPQAGAPARVFIALTVDAPPVGTSLRALVPVPAGDTVVVPTEYVRFSSTGPYVETVTGVRVPVRIVAEEAERLALAGDLTPGTVLAPPVLPRF